jgi:hypothetical protein
MPINVPAITWTEQADPSSPIASYAYSLSAPDDISFGLNAERFGIVTRPRFVSVDNTRNTASVTVRMYNASYTILGSQAQTVPIQAKTDRLQIIGANGTLGVTFFLSEPYASGINYSDLLATQADETSSVFSANLYTGLGAARTIITGIPIVRDGGMIWIVPRDTSLFNQSVFFSDVGAFIYKDITPIVSQIIDLQSLTAFLDNGFSLGTDADLNGLGKRYVCYTFKKSAGEFGIISYVGSTGASRTIANELGFAPDMIITVGLQTGGGGEDNWCVYSREMTVSGGAAVFARLNTNEGRIFSGSVYPSDPTDNNIFIGSQLNQSGIQYIMICIKNAVSGKHKVGHYIGNGSVSGPVINLGGRARFVIIKDTQNVSPWPFFDYARGTGVKSDANTTAAEAPVNWVEFANTGFNIVTNAGVVNGPGFRYIYWAIVE